MNWFYNLKLGTKLLSSFIIVALIAGLIGYIGIKNVQEIDNSDTILYEKMTVPIAQLGVISTAYQQFRVNLRDLLDAQTPEEKRSLFAKIDENRAVMDKESAAYEKLIISPEMKAAFEEFKKSRADYARIFERAFELIKAGNTPEAERLIKGEGVKAAEAEQKAIEKMVDMKEQDAKKRADENTAQANSAVRMMLILIAVGMVMAVGLGLFITRIISRPVTQLARAADQLALGDVNVNIEANTKDEIGLLAKSFRAMADNIKESALIVQKVAQGDLTADIKIRSEADILGKNLTLLVSNINALVTDANMLAAAAVDGRLKTRADNAKHQGEYRKIVEGVNRTLDAVIDPINEAAQCLQEMARGNMDVMVRGDYRGDHAVIKETLNTTLDAINEILSQVSASAEQVASAANQVSDSSQALSQGASESASAVEQVSSSMHEMGAQTNQNAENASQANQLAVQSRTIAEKGNGLMGNMMQAMGDINQSATNISKIIKVIDEIAFQTNLLALNAAVEAARAGKHGKGFTVVAEEVRNLAQRSAKAAKETTEMIEDSIKKTEVGTTLATDTAQSLAEIVEGATKVTDLISEIAAASQEQARGITQIGQGISQIDQVTQQNTASAQQSASASEELASQAVQLKEMMQRFTLRRQNYAAAMPMQHLRQSKSYEGGEANKNRAKGKNPEQVIALDDRDFGKF